MTSPLQDELVFEQIYGLGSVHPPDEQRPHRPNTARGRMQRDTRMSMHAEGMLIEGMIKHDTRMSMRKHEENKMQQDAGISMLAERLPLPRLPNNSEGTHADEDESQQGSLDMLLGHAQFARHGAQTVEDRLRSSEMLDDEMLQQLDSTEARLLTARAIPRDALSPR